MKDRNEIMRFFGLHPQNDVRRRFAFTLAEVLVTLGIIGVVAVLTVPNVISSYQKKVYVAQLQKVYNQISNAVALLMVDEEVDNLNDSSLYCSRNEDDEICYEKLKNFFNKYFKLSKDCGIDDSRLDCLADKYKVSWNEEEFFYANPFWWYCVILNSGASLCLSNPNENLPLSIKVDINAKKKPNTFGRDAFSFDMNYVGDIAESFDPTAEGKEMHNPERCQEKNNGYSLGCFTKIINDGWKMDY